MKNKITVNGVTFEVEGNNVSIINDRIYVDGKEITSGIDLRPQIKWDGPAANVTVDKGDLECGDISGNAYSDGSIHCKNIGGQATAAGSMSAGNIGGDVCVGGSINCGKVKGNIKAGGSVISS